MDAGREATLDATQCPECGGLAEVRWRQVVESTDGPVELARVGCVRRHWFLLPVEHLARAGSGLRLRTAWAS